MNETHSTPERANANPSKSFFISMLTRDIDLVDCILDLLDNSVDGIREAARRQHRVLPEQTPFQGHTVNITFDKDHFSISDKSGGIPLDVAQNYAFRFGRPDDAPELNEGTIGLYGIGMKRAIFKMGNHVEIHSSTGQTYFEMDLDISEWRRDPQTQHIDGTQAMEWSFELEKVERHGTDRPIGTNISIKELYEGIWRQFANPAFIDRLRRVISRDYALILNLGLSVTVNTKPITAAMPSFREGTDLAPYRYGVTENGVRMEITAGLADIPPDDVSATARNPDSGVFGWYVVCNDRVVVSADKSSDTGWGVKPAPAWHPQFIGFLGVVRFESEDPRKLPWKTTKRDVEASNPYFLRALPLMIRATKHFTDYTNARRADAKKAKRTERATAVMPLTRVSANAPAIYPQITKGGIVNISYIREATDVEAAADALGMIGSSPSEVGLKTFQYYMDREVSK